MSEMMLKLCSEVTQNYDLQTIVQKDISLISELFNTVLSDDQRFILEHRLGDNKLSRVKIAEHLSIGQGAVGYQQEKAIALLRREWQHLCDADAFSGLNNSLKEVLIWYGFNSRFDVASRFDEVKAIRGLGVKKLGIIKAWLGADLLQSVSE